MNDALKVFKTIDTVVKLIFREILEVLPGGGTLVLADLKTGTEKIEAGAILGQEGSTRKWHLLKTATVYEEAAAGATAIKVDLGHQFKAGDFICYGDVSTAIVSITAGALYDTINLTATLDSREAIPVDAVLYLGSAETTNGPTAGSAVVEDAEDDTLTVTDPRGLYNGVGITLVQNGTDDLAVAFNMTTRVLTISLAKTTATKNTAALIQAAIRALGVKGGVDFTDWTCAAAENWDTATVGGTLTVATDYIVGGIAKPAFLNPKYTDLGILKATVEFDLTEDSNVGVSLVKRATVIEANLPYGVPACYKTLLTERVRFA